MSKKVWEVKCAFDVDAESLEEAMMAALNKVPGGLHDLEIHEMLVDDDDD